MQQRFRDFVAKGKNQPSPWAFLKNQIYPGDDRFVEKLQWKIEQDQDLSEIPSAHKRPLAQSLDYYERKGKNRNLAIVLAYQSGGYTMKEIGEYFGVHYSRVSRVLKSLEKARPDPEGFLYMIFC